MVPRQRPAEDRHEDSIIPQNALPFRAAVVNRRVLRQVGEKTVRFYHRRDDGLLGAGLASSPLRTAALTPNKKELGQAESPSGMFTFPGRLDRSLLRLVAVGLSLREAGLPSG